VVGDEVRVAHVAGAQRREAPVGVGDGLAESGPGGPVALRPAGGLARPVDDDVQRRGDQRVAVDADPGRGRRAWSRSRQRPGQGALLVETEGGVRRVLAGEVSIRPKKA